MVGKPHGDDSISYQSKDMEIASDELAENNGIVGKVIRYVPIHT